MAFSLVHLSDLHFNAYPEKLSEWNFKRALGAANLFLKRARTKSGVPTVFFFSGILGDPFRFLVGDPGDPILILVGDPGDPIAVFGRGSRGSDFDFRRYFFFACGGQS